MLKSMIRIQVKGTRWQPAYVQPDRIKLTSQRRSPPGWYRVVVKAKNAAAKEFVQKRGIIRFTQNSNHHGAELLSESPSTSALVFLRHTPLRHVSLHFDNPSNKQLEFQISITRVTTARAWLNMLSVVSKREQGHGHRWDNIYRLTRARYKRGGMDVALRKLIGTYQPLLSYQTVSSDPYEYWCDRQEQNALKAKLDATPSSAVTIQVVIKPVEHSHSKAKTEKSVAALGTATTKPLSWREFTTNASTLNASHWYIFLDAGDTISEHAPKALTKVIHENPQAELIYSDHDKLSEGKYRIAPKFKPQWNPDFLYNQNYLGRAVWIRGDLVQRLVEQQLLSDVDYVLNLNAVTSILKRQTDKAMASRVIAHVPHILVHQHTQSQNPYSETAKTQIEAAMHRYADAQQDQIHSMSWRSPKLLKVDFALPENPPLVSLVIPTRDAMEITRTCIQSILERTSYPNYEILLVDNQSRRSDTLTWFRILERNPRVRIIRYDEAFNYSAINNYAVSKAQGEIIALVNNDTEVINRDWLTNMVRHAVRPNIGCVGAKLYFFDNTVQHAGVVLGIWGLAGHSHKHYHRSEPGHQQRLKTTQNLSAVTAACLVVRREIFEKVGGLEEDLRVAFNDVDFCLKVQSEGYRNLFTPDAELYHYESKTRGKEDTPEKKARELREIRYMRQKWAGVIAADPCYNPNLTRMREDFSLDIDEIIP